MMSFSQSSRPVVHVSLEPVYNILNSFSLLNATARVSGLNSLIVKTASILTHEQLHTNRLLYAGLRDALVPGEAINDFPTYLNDLARQEPSALRDRVLDALRAHFTGQAVLGKAEAVSTAPTKERLLSDVHAYLTCVQYTQLDIPFDAQLMMEAHALLNNPQAMHSLILSHLNQLWKAHFAAEWRRVQSSLRWQVEMFARSLDDTATAAETFRTFTGRDLPPAVLSRVGDVEELLLVPSWHTGHNIMLWEGITSTRLFFSEPPNYDIGALRDTPVGRAELRSRLSALADDARLRIIELLTQQDELHAQEIIAALELSQSSVSRHLKQLVSAGYLYERRGEGANKTYRLSSFYFARTTHALASLLAGSDTHIEQSAEKQEVVYARELKRFLDKSGKLTTWPVARQRDKLLILEYLAAFFEPGRMYSEKEVNDLLLLHTTFKDAAALRRALYEFRFLNRKRDGSLYWLIGADGVDQELLS